MHVNFNSKTKFNSKVYQKGVGQLADRFAHHAAFKALVKSGQITVQPKSAQDQKNQAAKDDLNARLARKAAKLAQGEEDLSTHHEEKRKFKMAQALAAVKANKAPARA